MPVPRPRAPLRRRRRRPVQHKPLKEVRIHRKASQVGQRLRPVALLGLLRQRRWLYGRRRLREFEVEVGKNSIDEDVVEVREAEEGLGVGPAMVGHTGRGIGHLVKVGPTRGVRAGRDGLSELGVHHLITEIWQQRLSDGGIRILVNLERRRRGWLKLKKLVEKSFGGGIKNLTKLEGCGAHR